MKNPMLAAVAAGEGGSRLGSRRGSAAGRSRAGSISLGGVERRGSYYGDDVSKRSTVAVVVDDPDGKKNMEKQLEAVFNGDGRSNPHRVRAAMRKHLKNTTLTFSRLYAQRRR